MDLSIIIVNWNTRELLKDCLKSIEAKTRQVNYEVIVVDNSSTDGSPEMVSEVFPDVNLIENKENPGFARANNQGLAASKGKYVLFLNPDTKILSNALDGMIQFLENNEEYGAVGCRLVTSDGNIQFTCARAFPTLLNQLSEFLFFHRLFPRQRRFSTVEIFYWDHRDSREVDCLSGACILVRGNLIRDIAGFSEEYYMYAEDVDLCYRIRKLGWKIYYLAEESILHIGGAASRQREESYFSVVTMKQSNFQFLKAHYGTSKAELFKMICLIGSILRMIGAPGIYIYDRWSSKKEIYPLRHWLKKYYAIMAWSLGVNNRK